MRTKKSRDLTGLIVIELTGSKFVFAGPYGVLWYISLTGLTLSWRSLRAHLCCLWEPYGVLLNVVKPYGASPSCLSGTLRGSILQSLTGLVLLYFSGTLRGSIFARPYGASAFVLIRNLTGFLKIKPYGALRFVCFANLTGLDLPGL